MNSFKSIITVGAITLFATSLCHAQLGGAAPLPKIQKSTGPSVTETTQWITEKLASLPSLDYWEPGGGDTKHSYVVSFDDCAMTLTAVQLSKVGSYLEISYVQLREMDVNKISIVSLSNYTKNPYSNLYMRSLGEIDVVRKLFLSHVTLDDKEILDRFTVKGDAVGPNGGYGFTASGKTIFLNRQLHGYFQINLQETEVAESMSNAFKHAVILCQKKAADEKAAQPPKKKELF